MTKLWMILTSLLLALLSSIATAQHYDVVPYANAGKLYTGAHDDGGILPDAFNVRVFGYDLDESDPGIPFVDPAPYGSNDPGFNNGSGFTNGVFPNNGLLPNGVLRYGITSNLLFWDGTGGAAFSPVDAPVSLDISGDGGTTSVFGSGLPATTGADPGLVAAVPSGRVHDHLVSSLQHSGGQALLEDGIYLVGMHLLHSTGIESDPFYMVYNLRLDESLHDEAIEWVEANLVPEPTSLSLAGISLLGMAAFARRRRRLR